MKKNKSILKIGKSVIKSEIIALKKLEKSLGTSFVKAVELIYNTKGNVVFTGVGKSKLILEKTCGTFSSLGITSYILDPTAANHGDLGRLQKKDVIIIASNSGNSNEFRSILKYAKTNKIKIIGITSNTKSKLYLNSDVKIFYKKVKEAGDKNYYLVPTSSTTLLTALGDALAIATATKKKFKISSFSQFHPSGSIGKSLSIIKDLTIPLSKLTIIKSNSSFSKTLSKISEKRLGCVLVRDYSTDKISLITDGDAARAARKFKDINKVTAKDFMTRDPICVNENNLILDTLKTMNSKKINAILIKKNKKILGLVTLHSILSFLENEK